LNWQVWKFASAGHAARPHTYIRTFRSPDNSEPAPGRAVS
jgi:hypothetical protein